MFNSILIYRHLFGRCLAADAEKEYIPFGEDTLHEGIVYHAIAQKYVLFYIPFLHILTWLITVCFTFDPFAQNGCLYMIPIISTTFGLDRHIEVNSNADADCYALYTLNIGHTARACCACWYRWIYPYPRRLLDCNLDMRGAGISSGTRNGFAIWPVLFLVVYFQYRIEKMRWPPGVNSSIGLC